jgi:hypothetical protein
MKSKKLMLVLSVIGAAHGALSTGCMVNAEVAPPTQAMSMQADVFDINGNPLDYPFDYYLDLYMIDGSHLIYHKDQQHTDINGTWSDTELNLQVYYDNGGLKCYDSCVSYDAYGCTAYATDCYNNSYTATLDTNSISSTSATIGIDTGTDYLAYAPSVTLASFHSGDSTFRQHDEFDTNILVAYNAARTQKTASLQGAISHGVVRASKPVRISNANLSQLNAAQARQLQLNRAALHLPAEAFTRR